MPEMMDIASYDIWNNVARRRKGGRNSHPELKRLLARVVADGAIVVSTRADRTMRGTLHATQLNLETYEPGVARDSLCARYRKRDGSLLAKHQRNGFPPVAEIHPYLFAEAYEGVLGCPPGDLCVECVSVYRAMLARGLGR